MTSKLYAVIELSNYPWSVDNANLKTLRFLCL